MAHKCRLDDSDGSGSRWVVLQNILSFYAYDSRCHSISESADRGCHLAIPAVSTCLANALDTPSLEGLECQIHHAIKSMVSREAHVGNSQRYEIRSCGCGEAVNPSTAADERHLAQVGFFWF